MKQGKTIWFLICIFFLLSCSPQITPTPAHNDETHPELKNIPIFPGNNSVMDGTPGIDRLQEGHTVYSYIAQTNKPETLQNFYEEKMPETGWELFGISEIEVKNNKSMTLLFSKSETIAEIEFRPWSAGSYLVVIDLSNSLNNQQ